MANWKKAQDVRAFRRALEHAAAPVNDNGGLADWLAWAEHYADRLDPLTFRPPSESGVSTSTPSSSLRPE